MKRTLNRTTPFPFAAMAAWVIGGLSLTVAQGAVVHRLQPSTDACPAWTTDDTPRHDLSFSRKLTLPDTDDDFNRKRWPCIIRGGIWSRGQESAPLPPCARELIPILKAAFAAQGLPGELAWVAEVESMWVTNAVSKSGARGLYQFKPEAARRFELLRDLADEREHPERSARAAARYLAHLYAQLGDWRLAIAAYNAGEGCVSRLLKSRRARTYDAIAADLPAQTQVYVIKVMTIMSLREHTALSALPAPEINPSGN